MDHSPSHADQAAAQRAQDEARGSFGAWTLVWTLVVMKLVTVAVVMLAARQAEAGALFAVITWHWLLVLGALLSAPLLFRHRLRRVRARRAALLRSEWMIGDDAPIGVPVSRGR